MTTIPSEPYLFGIIPQSTPPRSRNCSNCEKQFLAGDKRCIDGNRNLCLKCAQEKARKTKQIMIYSSNDTIRLE